MQKGFAPIIILVGILILASVAGTYYFFKVKTPVQRACTMDAKICPDGSGVGRSGPNCEFSPCPSPKPTSSDETANWKTYTNTTWNYQFQYPSTWIVDELDMEHVVVTSSDIEKSTDGRIVKFPAIYIRINIVNRENKTISFEEEIKLVYTESPQCSVGSECPSSPPLITKKTNANYLEYYSLTTGVYNNELAIFSLPKDKNRYVLIDPRLALTSNIKLSEKILSTFKFLDQKQNNETGITLESARKIRPLHPYKLTVVKSNNMMILKWDGVGEDGSYYQLYRKTASDQTWVPLTQVPVQGDNRGAYEYIDKSSPNAIYIYGISFVDSLGTESNITNSDGSSFSIL